MEILSIIFFVGLVIFIIANLRNTTPPPKPPRQSVTKQPPQSSKTASQELERSLREARARRLSNLERQQREAEERRRLFEQQQREERERAERERIEREQAARQPEERTSQPPPLPLGNITLPTFRPALDLPEPSQQTANVPKQVPETPQSAYSTPISTKAKSSGNASEELVRMLGNLESLQAAIVLKEVLGEPISRRHTRGGTGH